MDSITKLKHFLREKPQGHPVPAWFINGLRRTGLSDDDFNRAEAEILAEDQRTLAEYFETEKKNLLNKIVQRLEAAKDDANPNQEVQMLLVEQVALLKAVLRVKG